MIINRGKEPEWKLIIRTERDKERIFLGGDAQNKRNSLRFFPFSSVSYTFVFPVHLYYYKFTYSYFLDRISREGWQLLDRETRTLPYRFLLEFFLKSFSFVSRSSNHSSSFVESEERREGKGRRRSKARWRITPFPILVQIIPSVCIASIHAESLLQNANPPNPRTPILWTRWTSYECASKAGLFPICSNYLIFN